MLGGFVVYLPWTSELIVFRASSEVSLSNTILMMSLKIYHFLREVIVSQVALGSMKGKNQAESEIPDTKSTNPALL